MMLQFVLFFQQQFACFAKNFDLIFLNPKIFIEILSVKYKRINEHNNLEIKYYLNKNTKIYLYMRRKKEKKQWGEHALISAHLN